MSVISPPKPVKLICGLISNDKELIYKSAKILSKKFGPIDLKSQVMSFDHTAYYQKEMGRDLKRQFLSFSRLIGPQHLPKVKLFTNRLERRISVGPQRKRRINLDPGYISGSKLVLATGKNYCHRIYLGKGIYAEVTLYFAGGTFRPYEWTYPDYKTAGYIEFFNQARRLYLAAVKETRILK